MTDTEQTTVEQEKLEEIPAPASNEEKRDLSWHLDRIWQEVKEVGGQLESETRRGGRIAKLKLEILGLRHRANEHTSRLGKRVYEAHKSSDKRPTLSRVEGYDDIVAEIAAVESEMEAKRGEIAELKAHAQEHEAT
jgi:hypothetical protein